jgi:hypothetical protein
MVQKQFWMASKIQSINVVIEKTQINISFILVTPPLTEGFTLVAKMIIGQKVALVESRLRISLPR